MAPHLPTGVGNVHDAKHVGEHGDPLPRRFSDEVRVGGIVADTYRPRLESTRELAERFRIGEG